MVIITEYIAKKELTPLKRHFDLKDILEGGRKVLKHLGIPIKPPRKLEGIQFFKVNIGKNEGRMIVFVMVSNKKIVPLLIRLKKDKIYGMNMSSNNPEVVKQLNKNLDHVIKNIEENEYEEFALE
jgi:Cu2+-containing amine oxidase